MTKVFFVVGAMILVLLSAGVWFYFQSPESPPATAVPVAPVLSEPVAPVAAVRFSDITEAAGIDFVHVNGAVGERWLPETMGSGVAFFDYDNDNDQDLLLLNGQHWQAQPDAQPTLALYRNNGHGQFDNVTTATGLAISLYAAGCALGDIDNDGWVDLFIAALGKNFLLRNNNGHFEDISARAGVAGDAEQWSSSAAFIDYDNDADLDLFVLNYVRWSQDIDREVDFRFAGIGRAYGPPNAYQGSQPYLYRNNGDHTFSDVSAASGMQITHPNTGAAVAKALAVAPIDIDQDGWIDLPVANDTIGNFLYHNQRDGTFQEIGQLAGVAFDQNGSATGAMGIDTAYFRNDADLAIAIGNFANEMTSLYVAQNQAMQFTDETIVSGIGADSRLALSFGVFFLDVDLDGRLDFFQTNGHIENEINLIHASQQYEQAAQLFWNCGVDCEREFLLVPDTGDLAKPLVGRAAAYADIDNDGDLDIVITQPGRAARLFRNERDHQNHWLRLKLIGKTVNRDAIGASIELTAGGIRQRRQVMPSRSYLAQVELPVTFGLGDQQHVDEVKIIWPDAKRSTQTFKPTEVDTLLIVEQQ